VGDSLRISPCGRNCDRQGKGSHTGQLNFHQHVSFLKFLVAVGIATFGIWYLFKYDSINEVTGGVAFVSVCRECFLLLKWQPTSGSGQQIQLAGGYCERSPIMSNVLLARSHSMAFGFTAMTKVAASSMREDSGKSTIRRRFRC
jgi:hypothetical protein